MQYGFAIDHDRCIGCHACTVACKAENEVPVGSFRTWVKYTEQGRFPDVTRSFLVERCNHCTNAPCVTICPVNALEKRPDGIVDIDRDACIGCRACMQACPYDALYMNDSRGAVEKCHFCAHRVDRGLEPACVTVCPVEAIIPGDLHDPESRISLIVRNNGTQVRRAEQRTGPNVHYVGADEVALKPGSAARPLTYLWSDRPPHKLEPWPDGLPLAPDARVVLDAGHRVEWGWPVSCYLVTKGVGAGAAMLAPFAAMLGLGGFGAGYLPEILALVFTLITTALLVEDLAKPWAFYRMLTRPNLSSWLVRGALVLGVFAAFVSAGLVARLVGREGLADGLRWPAALAGCAAAGYTAFLFAQCKGRDLWESKLLLPHLLVQALMCGSVAFLPAAETATPLVVVALASLAAHVAFVLAERFRTHETDNARQAAAFLGRVRVGPLHAWRDGLVISVVLGAICLLFLPAIAFIPVLVGLYLTEHAYVRAAQLPPLS
ncbi:MAG: 4Fe-4S dicluster domain-containing protein [Planctomycetota bacterium]|jgi:Fe-S-cluster-containing dehydrogenase component